MWALIKPILHRQAPWHPQKEIFFGTIRALASQAEQVFPGGWYVIMVMTLTIIAIIATSLVCNNR